MKLTNIRGFRTIDEYICKKLEEYTQEEKTFPTLFNYMFSEKENVFSEISDGYRIKKKTYGECAEEIKKKASTLSSLLSDIPQGSTVGLYMNNSVEWIQCFWAILMCGYSPLLMNLRLDDDLLDGILKEYKISAVISDGKQFDCLTIREADITESDEIFAGNAWGENVIFMSSGTSRKVKLCAYNANNFYYQVCDSVSIVKSCPEISNHYEGELKLLTLLPLYHVFGFIAVYLWFGFFSRTFVFLKDMNPNTILNTVKKHKVTHIFAVPLVWDTVYKEAVRKIKERGDKTYGKFQKVLNISNSTGKLGDKLAKMTLSEVRENMFGDSIQFMISGGSPISSRVLEFFNGIGYHLANGFGMTEIGITSVEVSSKKKILNSMSIGSPFNQTKYSISDKGELLVKSKSMADKIIIGEETHVTDYDEWFNTKDIVKEHDGRYFIEGRIDDLIVCENGENINPVIAEGKLKTAGCDAVCLFADKNNVPTLVVSIPPCFSVEKLNEITESVKLAVRESNLEGEIKKIVLTHDSLIEGKEFKISRKRISERYSNGSIREINTQCADEHMQKTLSELELSVRECFATALEKSPEEISPTASFFIDLGGTSLDYFSLLNLIKSRFNTIAPIDESERLYTVRDFCEYIMHH